jgi:hypothetical protein
MSGVDDMQSWLDDAGEALARRAADAQPRPNFDDVLRRMSGLSPVEVAEGELTGMLAEAREGLDRRIDGAPQSATFGDVLARAHAMRPDVVDAGKLAEAQRLAPVVDLRRRSAGERALGVFVDDARAGVEAKIRDRASGRISDPRRRTRAARKVAAVVAVAAAGLFAVASFVGDPDVLEADRTSGSADAEQAQLIEEHEHAHGQAGRVEPELVEIEAVPIPEAPAVEVEDEIAVEPEPATPRRRLERERKPAPTLAELAALAKQQWRAGDLHAAEQTLSTIVERGGKSRWADNAFSDLFALAHRRGDARGQQHWWRAYLRRFPSGRFADDAQAGLCRASSKPACWAAYLERFPDGSYRGEARRMVKRE